ncbi:MAG: lipid-A-disaccharide synthase N-terminal domain-containing protein, partial [Oceanihabitans sp.]|nr:lipid-A-disaccharide synthase N-terminal domain-containing protein [Oceanihabitans sp.]
FGFWLLSLIGSTLILTYAIIRKDPVLFIGQLFGAVIYSRNLMLIKKSHVKNP